MVFEVDCVRAVCRQVIDVLAIVVENAFRPVNRRLPHERTVSISHGSNFHRFLAWVDSGRLEEMTKRFYRKGWRLLKATES